MKAMIVAVNARGLPATEEMQKVAGEYPNAFRQYQYMCNTKGWRRDLTGRNSYGSVVKPGDCLVFSDLDSSSFAKIVENPEDQELIKESQTLVFFCVVKTRPDKKSSEESFKRALKQVRGVLDQEGISDLSILPGQLQHVIEEIFPEVEWSRH